MTREDADEQGKVSLSVPNDWEAADIDQIDPQMFVVRRSDAAGKREPLSLPAGQRPILVDVHYGRSAIVQGRIDAIRYGFTESDVYTEFYYLQLIDEPEWVQITEESEEHDLGIVTNLDKWLAEGSLTEEEAEWADDQFD